MRLLLVFLMFGLPSFSALAADRIVGNEIVLQGLDKVTARISTISISAGNTADFGTLKITLRGCEKTAPEDPPEAAAFLEIIEQRDDEEPVSLFHGWMFASTPALSALEHPVYDVWVLECRAESAETEKIEE